MEEKDLKGFISQRIQKLNNIKSKDINPYPNKFDKLHNTKELRENYVENRSVKTAGRIMTLRKMGKAAFAHIKDEFGTIQVYYRMNDAGTNKSEFKDFIKLDIGDIIGVEGVQFTTNTGEESVMVSNYTLLSKSLRPLPEKWHGLKDIETRYRQRYVDLIVNDDVREIFKKRTFIIQKIREYLNAQNYLEVETPMMHSLAGGAIAKPFTTFHNALSMELYLRVAPELYLKRLIVGGFEKVYEINRNFRNEGLSKWHNPEFTMLEVYKAYADYNDMMDLTEDLLLYVVKDLFGKNSIYIGNIYITFEKPFKRYTMFEAIEKYTSLNVDSCSESDIYEFLNKNEVKVDKGLSKMELLNEVFENCVEYQLVQPTFITDYPKIISPLSKSKPDNNELVERFELFICGKEIGNAYSELNDPIDQMERFKEQAKKKKETEKLKLKINDLIDNDYVRALEYGMPPTGGLGIGIDRLIMLLTDSTSIREVVLFPMLKKE